jgi:hypothetical protein
VRARGHERTGGAPSSVDLVKLELQEQSCRPGMLQTATYELFLRILQECSPWRSVEAPSGVDADRLMR